MVAAADVVAVEVVVVHGSSCAEVGVGVVHFNSPPYFFFVFCWAKCEQELGM